MGHLKQFIDPKVEYSPVAQATGGSTVLGHLLPGGHVVQVKAPSRE
jgi:hypothetical protein